MLVLVGGLALSVWAYLFLQREAARREAQFFTERVAEAEAAIRVRMTHYVDALRGGASFFAAVNSFDREQWRVYSESLQLQKRYPGINGLGVILAVGPDDLGAWIDRVRSSGESNPEIKPFPGTNDGPANDTKYLITYLEGNVADRPPIGRNIATEPSRRRAAELARDTGLPQINRRVPRSRDTQRRSGLLLYVPLYRKGATLGSVAERRAALVGWVYAQVYPDVFLDGVLGPMGKALRLHFFEAGAVSRDLLLYASDGAGEGPLPDFERTTELILAGQPFQLGWQRGPGFPTQEKPPAVWVGGSLAVAGIFLAGLVWSLQSVGRRANAMAAARTAELAASEERFRQAFDAAGIGMALIALDGRWLKVNPSLCETLGYSEARLLQRRFQDITHPDDLNADLALMRELVEGQRRFYQLEKRFIHQDGHAVWMRLTASLVRDGHGIPLYGIAQLEDITEPKRLERVLAMARDEAVEAARLKSEFLTTMIDEIKTPVNAVLVATQFLREQPQTPIQIDYLRTIQSAGDSLLSVTHDILDYSKIEAGDIDLQVAMFDPRQCVNDALAVFRERADRKGVRLESTTAARVPAHCAGDVKRLQQILVNLLNNAIKLTDSGEVRVSLTAEALDATTGRQRLKFAVRDTGAGMAADRLERLFKAFSPVDALTRRLGGTGLGLAISSRLAEAMGGTMWAQSEPGRGSTFHFTVLVELREFSGAGTRSSLSADPDGR